MSVFWWLPFLIKDIILFLGGCSLLRRGIVIFPHGFHRATLSSIAICGVSILWYRGNFYPLFWALTFFLTYLSLFDFVGIFIKLKSIARIDRYAPLFFEGLACLLLVLAVFSQTSAANQPSKMPKHIAVICDGNGRFSEKHHIAVRDAYLNGADVGLSVASYCQKLGVEYLTAYVLSSENLQRDEGEIDAIKEAINYFIEKCPKLNMAVKLVTQDHSEPINFDHEGIKVTLVSGSIVPLDGLPNVDLIIRTGGRHRLSGFINKEIAYAEIYFSETLWPNFSDIELRRGLNWYFKQARTFGV